MINLSPTDEQLQVVASVVDFLKAECPVERLKERGTAPGGAERTNWSRFAALGWFRLGLPEALGGLGLSLVEETLVYREFGRYLISPCVLAASLAAEVAARSGNSAIADDIFSGVIRPALAMTVGGFVLNTKVRGELLLVDSENSGMLVVCNEQGAALIHRQEIEDLHSVTPMDTTLTLARGSARDITPVAYVPAAAAPLYLRARILVAAQLVAAAEEACRLAVEYAKIREQFGKPIGSFQAVAHHCADMAVRAEAAWAQTRFACISARDARADAPFQVAAANIVSADAAMQNTAVSIRVHGAIGFTADCSVHHYLKRAMMLREVAGGVRHLQAGVLAEPAPL